MEVSVDNGALRARDPSKGHNRKEGEGKEGEQGLAISPQELAAASASMRDAGQGWYRVRAVAVAVAVGDGGRVAAMTSVPVVRALVVWE